MTAAAGPSHLKSIELYVVYMMQQKDAYSLVINSTSNELLPQRRHKFQVSFHFFGSSPKAQLSRGVNLSHRELLAHH